MNEEMEERPSYNIRTIKLASARRLVLLMSCLVCGWSTS